MFLVGGGEEAVGEEYAGLEEGAAPREATPVPEAAAVDEGYRPRRSGWRQPLPQHLPGADFTDSEDDMPTLLLDLDEPYL